MDLLVRLYALEPKPDLDVRLAKAGITVRRGFAAEVTIVTDWVKEKFGVSWASEVTATFARQPPSCFLATTAGRLIGFACYDATARGFFGPTGVDEVERGAGVGHALLLACLIDMRAHGYGYAVIGDVGPEEFYARTVGAMQIAGSTPGLAAGVLKQEVDPLISSRKP